MPRQLQSAAASVQVAACEVKAAASEAKAVLQRVNRLLYDLRKQGYVDVETHVLGKEIVTTRIQLPST